MNETLLLVLASILILFLVLAVLFIFRGRAELTLEEHTLILKYPLSTKRINLRQELESWKIQKANYLRLGIFYTILIHLKNGKHVMLSSRFNQSNYNLLYKHLSLNFPDRRIEE